MRDGGTKAVKTTTAWGIGLLAAAAVSAGAAVVPAQEQESARTTVITFSVKVEDRERPALEELLRNFERQTPRVTLDRLVRLGDSGRIQVNLITVDPTELVDRLGRETRAGSPTIDLFAQDNLALWPLVHRGLVQPLADVPDPPEVPQDLLPPRFDNQRYFLPFRPNVRLTYTNRRCLPASLSPPTTLAALESTARQLRFMWGAPKLTLSLAPGDPTAVTISELILAFGGDPRVLNGRQSVRAFTYLAQLWQSGVLTRVSFGARFDTEVTWLKEETSCVAQNWSYTSSELANNGLLGDFIVGAGWRGPSGEARHVIGGDVLGIPTGVNGARREAAVALAKYLMSREAQRLLVSENTWPSIREDASLAAPAGQGNTYRAINDALRNGWYRPQDTGCWPVLSDGMNEAVSRILQQGEPLQAVLDDVDLKYQRCNQSPPR
jgi:ABC-type glycerol-3-phosphate transport system substrate-binding protein